MAESTEFLQWAIGQGVAVAVLAFILVRIDTRLTELMTKVQTLIDVLAGRVNDG